MSLPRRHSFSALNEFSDVCERRYAYNALIGEFRSSPEMERGTHVHAALEAVARRMTAEDGQTPLDAAGAVAAVKDAPPVGVLAPEALTGYLDRALPVFEHLHPMMGRVEEWFRDAGGFEVVGKIDLVSKWAPTADGDGKLLGHTENLCVIDYKTTGSSFFIPTPLQAQRSLQLRLYCLATGARRAGYVYFLPSGPPILRVATFSEQDLVLTRRWLSGTIRVIEHRWKTAAEMVREGPGQLISGPKGDFDVSVFALARPGHPFCGEKCEHWTRCIGKEQGNGTDPETDGGEDPRVLHRRPGS